MLDLAPDFDEFFGSLIEHGVEFLVVGAYALAVHGRPRYTGDLDILVRPTVDNAQRLLTALNAFGFPSPHLTPQDVVEPTRILQLGVEPVQIHLMSDISGVNWEAAWAGRVYVHCGAHEVPFIGRREFIMNKRAAGRTKDLADIEDLEQQA